MKLRLFPLAFLAAACAASPASPPVTAQPGSTLVVASSSGRLLAAAGGDGAPSRADIERALGAPDIARQDGAGAALTYRSAQCALLLVFSADRRNVLRLAQAHATAPVANAPSPSLDQCAAEMAARNR